MEGPKTPVWSYGPVWPNPVLRAKQGQEFKVRFTNMLERPINLHWFGVRGPSDQMSLSIEPGAANALDNAFTPPDAGTFWFGPVADVSRQREMGLGGMLVVEEAAPVPGLTEIAMILDDWKLTDAGAIEESFGNLEEAIAEGRLGNWFTVNGAYRPHIPGPANGLIRLRLLNAANVRTMPVKFRGADPLVIARDGQPVRPVNLSASPLVLAPGQRADLLVEEGSEPVEVALDLFEDVVEVAYIERSGGAASAAIPDNFALPPNPLPTALVLDSAKTVALVIEGGAKGGLKRARLLGEDLELRQLLERGFAWALNGVSGLSAEPWQNFALGETVVIAVDNRTKFDQPICIHGHVWQEIERDGIALEDEPWRDTAVIPPRKSAKLAFVAANPGAWGLHSTIAERLDAGLITSFTVAP